MWNCYVLFFLVFSFVCEAPDPRSRIGNGAIRTDPVRPFQRKPKKAQKKTTHFGHPFGFLFQSPEKKFRLPVNNSILSVSNCGGVRVGDRCLKPDSVKSFHSTISCWVSSDGNWIRRPEYPHLITKLYSPEDSHLRTPVTTECGGLDRQGLDYVWQPPAICPPMIDFSLQKVCQILRGCSLVFIGDSVTEHTYETFVTALQHRMLPDTNHSQFYIFCEENGWGKNFEAHWLPWHNIFMDETNYQSPQRLVDIHRRTGSVVVANWGIWYVPDAYLRLYMNETLTWFERELPTATFIFRTTNMAHKDCHAYAVPDNQPHQYAENKLRPDFMWTKFPEQRVLWRDYMGATKPGMIYLDILELVRKRPDQHSNDCLHYCVPGPIDTWVRLIFSILDQIEMLPSY